jgi:3',5'-cyclic AMP phosphodiesterase CpdA
MAQPGVRSISLHWRPQFTLPENGPDGLKESVYYLDYQGTRIISLNSNEQQDKQVAWLRSVLANNPQRWTVVTFHHPIVSPANGRDNPRLRELWQPVLDEFKVDLVLTGHDHTYARSGDLSDPVGTANVPTGLKTYDPAVGTVYVVSVSGPKMYNITNENFVRTAEDTQLFQVITVNGDEIHYEARTAIGQLYDAFVLKKRGAGQPNELRETLPPQNRRSKAATN